MTTTPLHDLDTVVYQIDALTPYHQNPRQGDTAAIAESLRVNGQYRPIVVNRGTRTGRELEVLAGNHTLAAARQLGWDTITATTVDVDDDAAARIVLADNRTSDLAGMDDRLLAELLASLDDLDGTGYDLTDLDDLATLLDTTEPPAPAEPAAPPATPVTNPGDVWQLGPHRVICADSTSPDNLHALTGGTRIDCMWTDPPYGVDYVGKTPDALTIRNDTPDGLPTLLDGAFRAATSVLRPGAPVYVAGPAGPYSRIFQEAFAAQFDYRQNLVWVKNTLVMGRADYHYRHEPILYGFTHGGSGRLGRGGPAWYGDDAQTTVFEVPKPGANPDHPTMKPVELVERMLVNSTRKGGTVLDPFGGSGSTLIAAHRLGRAAYLSELDPRYVDVICRRYQETTGDVPVRNGTPHDFTTV